MAFLLPINPNMLKKTHFFNMLAPRVKGLFPSEEPR